MTKKIQLQLTEETHKRLRLASVRMGRTMGQVVEATLAAVPLEDQERLAKIMAAEMEGDVAEESGAWTPEAPETATLPPYEKRG